MSDRHCRRCAAAEHRHTRPLTEAELGALDKTRLVGTRDGAPIIAAVMLPRRGVVQFEDMPRPALCEWDTPAFRCPWSMLSPAPVLRHGPEWHTLDGSLSSGLLEDEFHRASHCPMYSGGYFVRPFRDAALPRRTVGTV
ncbi:MAG: hypothetical protein ACREFI_03570 [Stellaceae bacterium]